MSRALETTPEMVRSCLMAQPTRNCADAWMAQDAASAHELIGHAVSLARIVKRLLDPATAQESITAAREALAQAEPWTGEKA